MTVANSDGGRQRRYHAPRRIEQAAATRAAIIDAAARLFRERGYAGTTMTAIAEAAKVTAKSVYAVAEKPQLLLLAVDRAIVGDDQPIPIAERPAFTAITGAEPRRAIQLAAELSADTMLRLYPIYRVLEQAAGSEPGLYEHWVEYQQRRRRDVALLVGAIQAASGLRPGLTADAATDTIWALLTWHPVYLLVEQRGMTRTGLVRWFADVLGALLLPPA